MDVVEDKKESSKHKKSKEKKEYREVKDKYKKRYVL